MYNTREYNATPISSATTTTVVTGKGILQAITVGTTAAGAITVYGLSNGTNNSGTPNVLKASIAEGTYWYNATFATSLIIVTAGASGVTVTWTQ